MRDDPDCDSPLNAERLLLDRPARSALWARVVAEIERYAADLPERALRPVLDPQAVRDLIQSVDFDRAVSPERALDVAMRGLWSFQTHTAHPGCFGLFVPAPTTMGIAAEALVAAFNPQLANWAHSPFGAELEAHLVQSIAKRLGFCGGADGTFTSGGAEANHTALLVALNARFPAFRRTGLCAFTRHPVLYVSQEAHDSTRKAASLTGIGQDAVHVVAVDRRLMMDVEALREFIAADRRKGLAPFMVVGTAGSTNAGQIDPLDAIGTLARREGLWFHVDGAWGAAAALAEPLRPHFCGMELADSLTLDAHKWLSVPMGAGLFMTRHSALLENTFSVETVYMPRETEALTVTDAYRRSMQWSRRFAGLKLFLSLAVAGWDGYERAILRQAALGVRLREVLAARGWQIVNDTPLPVVCFVDATRSDGASQEYLRAIVDRILRTGRAWISATCLARRHWALRACISNLRSAERDVTLLADLLDRARRELRG